MSTKTHYLARVTWTGDTASQIEVRQVTDTTTEDGSTKRSTRRVKLWQPTKDNAVHTDEELWSFLYDHMFLTTTKKTRTKDGRTKTVVLASRYIDPDGTPKGIPVPEDRAPAEVSDDDIDGLIPSPEEIARSRSPYQWGTGEDEDKDMPEFVREAIQEQDDARNAQDAAAWKLAELDHLSTLIQQNEAAIRELYAQRVEKVKDLMHLDGVSATEVAGRLGISRRRVYKMIEQPQGPVSDSTPGMF